MGRPKEFLEGDVLTAAMHVFRHKGYRSTTIVDLEKATGRSAGSLYNAFCGKPGLFDASFRHYLKAVLQKRVEQHSPEGAGLEGLRSLFLSLLDEPDGGEHGCLITNSAIEFGANDHVREGFRILSETFRDRISSLIRSGAVRADTDPAQAASRLLALYQGTLVLFRAGHDQSDIRRAIVSEFQLLEA